MRVNYNASAFMSASCLKKSENSLTDSLKRLSSGLKINDAKDDPSGLAIAKRMNLQIRGVKNASDSTVNGKSIIETADGALNEVHDILQRMNQLCVQASNGTVSNTDRESIQAEINQLKDEITRISKHTDFNGQPLLNGQFDLKGYTNVTGVKIAEYTDGVKAQKYELELTKTDDGTNTDVSVTLKNKGFGTDLSTYEVLPYDKVNKTLTITGQEGFSMTLRIDEEQLAKDKPYDVELDVMGIGAMNIQIGANEGQMLEMRIPEISLENIGIERIDLSTMEGAQDALERMDDAIDFLSTVRGRLGAYENRLEHTQKSLDVTDENMTSAYSRVMDVDMAEEMTTYTSVQVLTQAGTTMVAQANQRPEQLLQLLQ